VGILSLPPSAAKDLITAAHRSDKKGLNPTDPEDGYSFVITKTKTGSKSYNVKYSVWANLMDSGPIDDWSLLDEIINLDEVFPPPDEERQREVLKLEGDVASEQTLLTGEIEDDDDIIDVEEIEDEEEDEDDDAPTPSQLLKQQLLRKGGKK
jgi:hypothetical protein